MTASATGVFFGLAFAFFWLGLVAVGIACFVFWIMSLVDIARRPDWQFKAAGLEKVTWLVLVALIQFFGIIYWFAIRRRVVAVEGLPPPMMVVPMYPPYPGYPGYPPYGAQPWGAQPGGPGVPPGAGFPPQGPYGVPRVPGGPGVPPGPGAPPYAVPPGPHDPGSGAVPLPGWAGPPGTPPASS